MAATATMLSNASKLNIGYAVQNNHFVNTPERGAALKDLYDHVAAVALHTSDVRVAAPKCHEETRKAVQQLMSTWASRDPTVPTPQQPQELLWLTGPAGTGKTAIMGTVSDTLEKAGHLVATFYFSSAMGTTSKKFFITTLAYQMAVHKTLRTRLEQAILSAVRDNPDVFDMSLARQLELLILEPLRSTQNDNDPVSRSAASIVIDGVDECDGSGTEHTRRSRQENQIEVLTALFQAAGDPAFPFHIIIASRPETWIRRCLTGNAVTRIREIFLDEKYSPARDIQVYLQSKFAEKCQRSGIDPSNWPLPSDIDKLVENASGQFIYAATVVRWVDTPGTDPQKQLDAVMNLKVQPGGESHPFTILDTLYTSILKSTPDPVTTVVWLKGVRAVQRAYMGNMNFYQPSAWTVNRLFEAHEGQAQRILGGVPSLVYTANRGQTDLNHWRGTVCRLILDSVPGLQYEASYAFYHKSFLEYLRDDLRCGVAFPNANEAKVKMWLSGRVSQTLKSRGPEVPIRQDLVVSFFRILFLELVADLTEGGGMLLDADVLADCEPNEWFTPLKATARVALHPPEVLCRALYILVHGNCWASSACNQGCLRWRQALLKIPSVEWTEPSGFQPWTSEALRLDRSCIQRLPPESIFTDGPIHTLFRARDLRRQQQGGGQELAGNAVENLGLRQRRAARPIVMGRPRREY